MSLVSIGEAARLTGASVQGLRYYHRRGIVRPSARRSSGYRLYSAEDIQRIRIVRWAQSVGFSLREAGKFIHVPHFQRRQLVSLARQLAARKAGDLQAQMTALKRKRTALRKVASCKCSGDCRLLQLVLTRPAGSMRQAARKR